LYRVNVCSDVIMMRLVPVLLLATVCVAQDPGGIPEPYLPPPPYDGGDSYPPPYGDDSYAPSYGDSDSYGPSYSDGYSDGYSDDGYSDGYDDDGYGGKFYGSGGDCTKVQYSSFSFVIYMQCTLLALDAATSPPPNLPIPGSGGVPNLVRVRQNAVGEANGGPVSLPVLIHGPLCQLSHYFSIQTITYAFTYNLVVTRELLNEDNWMSRDISSTYVSF